MTKTDQNQKKGLTDRQLKAIVHLVSSVTLEEGRKKARLSKDTLFRWLKNPDFKAEIKKVRDIVISEALDILKQNTITAVHQLVKLLDKKISDNLRRSICNDIINYTLKARELEELEARVADIEKLIKERKL